MNKHRTVALMRQKPKEPARSNEFDQHRIIENNLFFLADAVLKGPENNIF